MGESKIPKDFLPASMLELHRRLADAVEKLGLLADHLGEGEDGEDGDRVHFRVKREDSNGGGDMGVT